ncbi:MAG: penicillin-binding protein [Acidobacteria bacterium]|nr:penicillin-binding protein [Acidobacteriota bacterium]
MRILARGAASVTVLLFAVSLAACTPSDSGAKQAAQSLASGLSKLDVSSLNFSGGKDGKAVTDEIGKITKALAPLHPAVSVASVEDKDPSATVKLDVKWDVSGGTWSYQTSASMTKKEGAWSTAYTPAVLVPELTEGQVLAQKVSMPTRANILGANDAVLVTERPVVHIGLDKTHVTPAATPASAQALATLVGVDPAAFAAEVAAAGDAAFVEAITLRDDATRTVTDRALKAIEGASAIKDSMALAPTSGFARAILGTVGQPTAEQVAAPGSKYTAGQIAGLSGLQAQYNDQLQGKPGVTISVVDAAASTGANSSPKAIFQTDPQGGTPLKTTLDPRLQTLGENVLAEQNTPAAIVAIRPSTGEVVAAASSPGSQGYNTALLGQYPPGSTFKVATSLALLRHGQTPNTVEHCTPNVTVDGTKFNNAGTYPVAHQGEIPLRDAFAHSCNTAFISARDVASQQDLAQSASSLGIGVESPLGTDAFFGSVPDTETATGHAASMIGQGKVLVSPLAIATVAASVEKGSLVSPILIKPATAATSSPSGTGAPSATNSPSSSSSVSPTTTSTSAHAAPPLTSAEAETLKGLMRGVVTSGHAGFLASIPGEPVIAKTGTAEYGSDTPPKTHAWIIAAQGDLAVAVFVENGDYGAVSGGPLLSAFLTGAGQG